MASTSRAWTSNNTNFTTAMYSEDETSPSSNMSDIITEQTDQEYRTFYESAQFATGLVLYPIICLVGITGNILVLIILNQRKMVTSTNVFLSALAVADLIKLLNDTLYFIVSILMRTNPHAGNQMMGYMYPVSHYIFNESVCVASWLTVCIGMERFLYVCRISQARKLCTVQRARWISATVFIVMSIMAIPSALRYKRASVMVNNRTMFQIQLTSLGENEYFMSMYMWTINLLRSVIPLCMLVVLNSCIIQALRKHRVKGKISRKNRITFMLIIVIVVFVVCITPDAVMSTVFGFGYVEASYLVKGIRECTDTLLAANSAANFTIYCVCSKGFRDTCSEVFCQTQLSMSVVQLDSVIRVDGRNNSSRPLLAPDPKNNQQLAPTTQLHASPISGDHSQYV